MSTTSLVSIAYVFAILRARTREEGKTPVGREFVITSSKKRERKGIIRGRQIAVTALQDVFARARTWCSGGAGAMTGTDRTNWIVRRNPLFFLIRQLFPLLRALCILEIRGSNAAPLVPHSLRSRIEILKFRGVQFRFCWRASRRLSRNLASVVFGNYRLTGFDRDGGGVLKVSSVGFHRRISPG